MSDPTEQENRLRKFAGFFKGYMGVMPVVTAAVAPLLTMMKAIPVFESQKTTLATYSGLLGFLLLAWVFYVRRAFARAMIPPQMKAMFRQAMEDNPTLPAEMAREWASWRMQVMRRRTILLNLLPLLFILASVSFYLDYTYYLDDAITAAHASKIYSDIVTRSDVLQKWGQRELVLHSTFLQLNYFGIFLFAEMAFVLMALREYAYGVLKVPEAEILGGFVEQGVSQGSETEPHKKSSR